METKAVEAFQPLQGRRVLIGVSSSIALYKSCDLVRRLMKKGAAVRVVMTPKAAQLVTPLTFEALSGQPAVVDAFAGKRWEDDHIGLADWAQCFVVAPATANVIGKLAAGIADDLLTTTALTVTCPKAVAPAMNDRMYLNSQVQANLRHLAELGWAILEPTSGALACGGEGVGRLMEPEDLADAVQVLAFPQKDLEGLRCVVTAGPTREALDPVRYLCNKSSGKMGYAIARAARDRGARVTLISGPVALKPPVGVQVIRIESARELLAASLKAAEQAQVFVGAAAVGDFRAAYPATEKLKRGSGELAIVLQSNPDTLAEVARTFPELVKVGFAAESGPVEAEARRKLAEKQLDMIVANDVTEAGAGFEVDTNRALLILRTGEVVDSGLVAKEALAHLMWDKLLPLLAQRGLVHRRALASGDTPEDE